MVAAVRRSTLVVLVAPSGPLGGVRDALQDWSALGLVEPFIWIENPPSSASATVQGIEFVRGRTRAVTLQRVLATRQYARVRLCIVVPALRDQVVVSPEVEQHLSSLIRATSGSAPVEHIRCVVTRPCSGPGLGIVARESWHNLVISPEDSRGPGLGHHRLDATIDPFELGPHAAAALCSVVGLWSGIDAAPLDDTPTSPGAVVRVVRGYFRHLDAVELDQSVRNGVLAVRDHLPRPGVSNGRAAVIEDVQLATSTMAQRLWSKHGDVLRGTRVPPEVTPVQRTGPWQALQMLFTFLGASLRNAPVAWYRSTLRKVSSTAAAGVHAVVFGGVPSAYQVVVSGTRPDGSPADWRDLAAASAEIRDAVPEIGEPTEHAGHVNLARLWQDYAHAALTLADAGERSDLLPPVAVGADRGVLRTADDCVPGPDSAYHAVDPSLDLLEAESPLAATDLLGIQAVLQRLKRDQQDPVKSLQAERTVRAVTEWASSHQHTFAVQTGRWLERRVTELRSELTELILALKSASDWDEPDDDLSRKQKSLATWLRLLLVSFLLFCLVFAVLGYNDVKTWDEVAIRCGEAAIVWFFASFVLFLWLQRNIFAELSRRRRAVGKAKVHRLNLSHALADLRRVTDAYEQYLDWSLVLGVVLNRPFGSPDIQQGRPMLGAEGLPLAVRLGVARPEPLVLADTIARVRRNFYRAGWLTGPLEAVLGDAHRLLGADGIDLADDPERLYSEPAGPGSLLTTWAHRLSEGGPGHPHDDAVGKTVLTSILGSSVGVPLLERVSVAAAPGDVLTRSLFMNTIDDESGQTAEHVIDSLVFTPTARAAHANAVTRRWQQSARVGLSQSVAMVELTDAVPPYQLTDLERQEVSMPDDFQEGGDF